MPLIATDEPLGFVDIGHRPELNASNLPQTRLAKDPEPAPAPPTDAERRPALMNVALEREGAQGISAGAFPRSDVASVVSQELGREALPVVPSRPLPESASVIAAAFRQENLIGSAISALDFRDRGPIDAEHNPFELIKGTDLEPHWQNFVSSRNADDTARISQRIRQEQADRDTISAAGWRGVAASMAASVIDPSILLPAAAPLKAARLTDAAISALKVGASVGAATAVQEAGLQSMQEIRPWHESAVAVGGAVVLGGILGGAVSMFSRKEYASLARRFDEVMTVPADGAKDPFGMGGLSTVRRSVGAEAVNKPEVELKDAMGGITALKWQDPVLRTLTSPLKSAKEAGTQLFETVLGITRNADGVTTAPVGGSVETRIKTNGYSKLGSSMSAVDEAFSQYRFAKPDAKFAAVRAGIANMTGQSQQLTYKQFKEEVGRAMARHDKHDNPHVARAAAAMRSQLIDPLGKEAVDLGLLDESIVKGFKASGGNLVSERPAWGSEAHAQRQSIGEMVEGIGRGLGLSADPAATQAAIDALARVNPDILAGVQKAYADFQLGSTVPGGANAKVYDKESARKFLSKLDTSRLTREEVEAVDTYARLGVDKDGLETDFWANPQNIALFESVANKMRAPHDMVVFRGGPADDDLLARTQELFTPTTLSEKWAETMGGFKWSEPGIERIVIAKGTPIIPIFRGDLNELEILLPKNTPLKQGARSERIVQGEDWIAREWTAGGPQSPAGDLIANLQKMFDDAMAHPSAAPPAKHSDFMPEQVAGEVWGDVGQSYITRIYNRQKIASERAKFENIIVEHFLSAQQRAQATLSRLSGGGAAGKEMDNLAEFANLSRAEMRDAASNTVDAIMGVAEGRMMFELPASVRGPLKARTLRIKDELIEEYLERDIETIARFYTRSMAPDIEMVRAFGDLEMKEAMAKIAEEAAALSRKEGITPKESARIVQAAKDAQNDLMAMADRLRGTYAIPEDPTKFLPTLGRVVRSLNYLRLLGGMTISAIPDTFRAMQVHGVTSYFGDGLRPLIGNLEAVKMAGAEVKLAGTALDMVLDTRAMAIADVMDDFGRYSKFERGIQAAQSNFGVISLMAPWNAAMKQWVGMMTMTNVLRAAQRVADGTAGKDVIEKLARSNIDEPTAKKIAELFREHGQDSGGVLLPNTAAWNTAAPGVRKALDGLRGAIALDVDRTIVTPGQDKPLWFSTQVGKIVSQFKGFGFASAQRVLLANLQQRDAGVMMGSLLMIGMGGIAEKIRSITNQKEGPKSEAEWVANAIERSGLTAYLFDVNHFTERFTGGAVGISALTGGKPMSRYAARNWADAVAGPTGGLIKDLAGATSGASQTLFHGERVNESDIRALRRTLPYQNLFYFSWLFQQMQKSAAESLNAKPIKERR